MQVEETKKEKSTIKSLINFGWGVYLGLIFLVGVVFVLASSKLPNPYYSFIIKSGSMEPSIMTGDLIIGHVVNEAQLNDVITFTDDKNRVITHRVIEMINNDKKTLYRTQGDANEDADLELISNDRIIGKVFLVFKYLGYLAVFLQKPYVLLTLVLFPAILLWSAEVLFGGQKPSQIDSVPNDQKRLIDK